jgi:hypothetical protein
MSSPIQDKWYHHKEEAIRGDIVDAISTLRHIVENQGTPKIALTHLNTYQQRDLTAVQTTRVGEWELGYSVKPVSDVDGFFARTIFAMLHGGRFDELNKREQEQIIMALVKGGLDEGSGVRLEIISPSTFAIHQNFAVMFWKEGNPNLVVPSKELLNQAFDPFHKGEGEDEA